MTFTFWFTLSIGAIILGLLIAGIFCAVTIETRRIIHGIRTRKPASPAPDA